jgi:hypothetical protein
LTSVAPALGYDLFAMGERFHIGHFERAFERQQFGAMKLGELRKALLALFQEPYFNPAPILRG